MDDGEEENPPLLMWDNGIGGKMSSLLLRLEGAMPGLVLPPHPKLQPTP